MRKCKFCTDSRAKLKHGLWLGDLNASLNNSTAITRHLIDQSGGTFFASDYTSAPQACMQIRIIQKMGSYLILRVC